MIDSIAVGQCLQDARDRLKSAHSDIDNDETKDAIFCVMRAVNHLVVAIDIIATPDEDGV